MPNPKRAELEQMLREVGYPCGRAELVEHAAAQGAGDDLLGHLCALPERSYDSLGSVDRACAELQFIR